MKSKSYESITFEVEKELKKPNELYNKSNIKDILSRWFERGKNINENQNNFFMLMKRGIANEELEILHYNLYTEKNEFFNKGKKSLIQGLILA